MGRCFELTCFLRPGTSREPAEEQREDDGNATRIANSERAIGEVGHSGSKHGRRDDGRTVQKWVEHSRLDLCRDEADEDER